MLQLCDVEACGAIATREGESMCGSRGPKCSTALGTQARLSQRCAAGCTAGRAGGHAAAARGGVLSALGGGPSKVHSELQDRAAQRATGR